MHCLKKLTYSTILTYQFIYIWYKQTIVCFVWTIDMRWYIFLHWNYVVQKSIPLWFSNKRSTPCNCLIPKDTNATLREMCWQQHMLDIPNTNKINNPLQLYTINTNTQIGWRWTQSCMEWLILDLIESPFNNSESVSTWRKITWLR